jgi:autotransporter-associated beta strand protein
MNRPIPRKSSAPRFSAANSPVLSLGLSFASLFTLGSAAQAATLSWTSTADSTLGGTGTWNTAATNWWNGASAQAWTPNTTTDNTAVLAGTAGTVTLGEGINALGLQATTTGYTVALAGNTLSLGAGGLDASTLTGGTTTISGTGTVALTGVQPWNVGSGATVAVSSVIGGPGITLTKTGAGTLALSGGNSYTGTTAIQGGTIAITANNNLGTSAVTLDGGTLQVTLANTSTATTNTHVTTVGAAGGTIKIVPSATLNVTPTFNIGNAGNVTGSGTLTVVGTGTLGTPASNNSVLVLGQANAGFTGATVIQDGGIVEVNNATAFGSGAITVNNQGMISLNALTLANAITLNGGVLQANSTTATFSGPVSLGAAGGILRTQNWYSNATRTLRVSGVISGSTGVTIDSGASATPGLAQLAGTNTYSGGTTVSTTNVDIQNAAAFGTGNVTVNGISRLYGNAAVTVGNNFAINGTSAFYAGSNITYSGAFTGAGILDNTAGNGGASINVTGDLSGFTGTFRYLAGTNNQNNFNIGGTTDASMNLSSASVVLSGAVTGGARALTLGGGGPGNTFKVGDLSGTGQVRVGAGKTLEVGALGLTTTFGGAINETGAGGGLTKTGAGTLTLSAASGYTGPTTVSNGTLQVGNGTAGSISGASAVTITPGTTLALDFPATTTTFANGITNNGTLSILSPNDLTLSGAIEGTGSIQKTTAGTLTLGGFSGTTGTLHVTAGKLQANGFLDTAPVTLGPAILGGSGSVGAVTVNDSTAIITNGNANTDDLQIGSLAFATAATLSLNKSNDTESPALTIAGNLAATSPGTVINLATSPAWVSGQTYKLISYGSLSGSAANLVKGTIPGLGGRQSATLGTTGTGSGFVTLAIGGDSPYWTGANNNTWTTAVMAAPKNWKLIASGSTTDFQANDQVLFNDNATGSTTVDISAANVPVVAVTFDNSAKDYTITSSGGFGHGDDRHHEQLLGRHQHPGRHAGAWRWHHERHDLQQRVDHQ